MPAATYETLIGLLAVTGYLSTPAFGFKLARGLPPVMILTGCEMQWFSQRLDRRHDSDG